MLSDQCLVCGVPLAGAWGAAMSWLGIGRSTRNPNCCTRCNTHIEEGRLVEMTVLFADLSSFTALTNKLGAESTFETVDAYLKFAAKILTDHGAYIDKYIGDSVMVFFNIPVKRADHARAAVAAAGQLQAELPGLAERLGLKLQATIGVASGTARVGRLGSDDIRDYTAVGEVVNRAARLQAQARAGEILVGAEVYREVAADFPGLPRESLTLKGFSEPCAAYRIGSVGHPPPPSQKPWSRKSAGLGTLLAALLGTGCIGASVLGATAVWLGAGSAVLLGARRLLLMIDHSAFHLPILVVVAAMAVSSLLALRREKRLRSECATKEGCIAPTPREKRHTLIVACLANTALTFTALELLLHFHFHHTVF